MDGASREEGCSSSNNDNDSKEIPCPLRQNMSCAFFPSLVVDMKTFVWGGKQRGNNWRGPLRPLHGSQLRPNNKSQQFNTTVVVILGSIVSHTPDSEISSISAAR